MSQRSTFVPFVLPFTACKQAGTWRFVSTAGRPRPSAERSISRSVFEIADPSVLRGTMNSSATDVRVQIDERNCGSQCPYKASALSASQHQERRRSKTLTTLWLRFLHSSFVLHSPRRNPHPPCAHHAARQHAHLLGDHLRTEHHEGKIETHPEVWMA